MTILWSNNASTTISGSITTASTSVQLAAGTGASFPNPTGGNFYVATFYDQATKTINEIVHVTAMAGDIATIVRAQEGTTAKNWNAGDIFANLVTAGTLNNFVQAGTGPANTSLVYVGTDTSVTPNLVIATTNPVPTSFAIGMLFNILIKNTNTAAVNVQLNGLASVPLVRSNGAALLNGDIIANMETTFVYNGVNFNNMLPDLPKHPVQTVFYVNPSGNDNNSGLANTSAQAFATVSGAMNQIKTRYTSQTTITIRVADGVYIDAFYDNTNYIASWNIVGNTTTPGNVTINAISTSGSSYPSAYAGPGRGCVSYGTAVITINGLTFQSFYENAAASGGGYLQINNCVFTSPTSGASGAIGANTDGKVQLYGNCSYSGSVSNICIFYVYSSGTMTFGYHDAIATNNLSFNIVGTPPIATATMSASGNGTVVFYNTAVTFTGGIPTCMQYNITTGGGIISETGVYTMFPGTIPGQVTPPGWL